MQQWPQPSKNVHTSWHSLIERPPPEYLLVEIQTPCGIRRGYFDPLEWNYGWLLKDGCGQSGRCGWSDGRLWRPLGSR